MTEGEAEIDRLDTAYLIEVRRPAAQRDEALIKQLAADREIAREAPWQREARRRRTAA